MAKSDEKWLMFKQFMYNEIGLTKEDIRGWIEDTVKQEIQKMLNDSYSHFSISEIARKAIISRLNDNYGFRRDLFDSIASRYELVEKK